VLVTSEQFEAFVQRHAHTGVVVAESNATMRDSYLILDENMCFLDCTGGEKTPSPSILRVPVPVALAKAGYDATMFHARRGVYDWSRKGSYPGVGAHGTKTRSSRPTVETLEF
jgi:radical S-adenosyl methionine domain-containing protein 2